MKTLKFKLYHHKRLINTAGVIWNHCIALHKRYYRLYGQHLNKDTLKNEPLWSKRSTLVEGKAVVLAIEVVSTNWQDDYLLKQGEYERLGIPEYWIVDYLGLGGKRLIGNPKQPTLTICELVEGEYQMRLLRNQDPLVSRAFPKLELTVDEIFAAGQENS